MHTCIYALRTNVPMRRRCAVCDQGLSSETARHVGMDWQYMSHELRELYMANAQREMDIYNTALLAYRETD